jgi:hypothetical protein
MPVIISTCALVVSVLSLILSARGQHVGGPVVHVDWNYRETTRELSINVENSGRSDVEIKALDLTIVYEEVIWSEMKNRYGQKTYHMRKTEVGEIPASQWSANYDAFGLPFRLPSYSSMPYALVQPDAIRPLLSPYPLDKVVLKCIVRFPRGKSIARIRSDDLEHFIASSPDVSGPSGLGRPPAR